MIVYDADTGEIKDGRIRYLMLRADVLMGAASELPQVQSRDFIRALEHSAFRHARDSFEQYRNSGRFEGGDFLMRSAEVAAVLGWANGQ